MKANFPLALQPWGVRSDLKFHKKDELSERKLLVNSIQRISIFTAPRSVNRKFHAIFVVDALDESKSSCQQKIFPEKVFFKLH
jgi:hypothetical protein